MNRFPSHRHLLPALLALSALLPGDLRAATWPGAGGTSNRVSVHIPEGALPPGPALLGADIGGSPSLQHKLRFEMPSSGAADLGLWVPADSLAVTLEGYEIFARSEAGPEWRHLQPGGLPVSTANESPAPRFLGTPLDLVTLRGAMDALGIGTMEGANFQIQDPNRALDCRVLGAADFVIADASVQSQELLRCAALGSRILLVGGEPGSSLVALPQGQMSRWGMGWVGRVPDFRAAATRVALLLSAKEQWTRSNLLNSIQPETTPAKANRPGMLAILLMLLTYVLVIGPVGYLVGIRPRRVLVAWGWFPAVAGLATLVAWGVSLTLDREPVLRLVTTTVLAPGGEGLRRSEVRLEAPYARTFALELPWGDHDLAGYRYVHHFGSPFREPKDTLTLSEDAISGSAHIRGLSGADHGSSAIGWVAPVRDQVPRVLGGEGLAIVENTLSTQIAEGIVFVADRCGRFGQLDVGETLRVPLESCQEPYVEGDPSWLSQIRYYTSIHPELAPGQSSFVLAAMLPSRPVPEIEIQPSIPVWLDELFIVTGVLPGEVAP